MGGWYYDKFGITINLRNTLFPEFANKIDTVFTLPLVIVRPFLESINPSYFRKKNQFEHIALDVANRVSVGAFSSLS